MEKLQKVAEALKNHGFKTQLFDTAEKAKQAALLLIGDGSVGFGGSMTINDLNIYEDLQKNGNKVYWHWKVPPEERVALFPIANSADTYICSSNAVLEGGALLNIDGNGNRVSSMYCGPKQVIVIVGKNKIAATYEEGIERIKKYACPPNGKRLGLQTPCALTDKCTDCSSPQRMCNVTVLLERPGLVKNIHVFLVNEDLGF